MFWLILADAAILNGGVILAMYIRLGFPGSENDLNSNLVWLKVGLASAACLLGGVVSLARRRTR